MTGPRLARWCLCACTAALLLGGTPALAQTYWDSPGQRLAELQEEEARLLRLRAEYIRLLDDDGVLFLDRPLRPGSGPAEDELYGRGLRRIPIPVARTAVRDYLTLGVLAGFVTGADPLDLISTDAQVERLWTEWQAEDQRIRQYLRNLMLGEVDNRLAAVRTAAQAILAERDRPQPQSSGWHFLDVVHGLQSESQPGLFGGSISVAVNEADGGGGSASIRVALSRGCTESYVARWSFSEPVDWSTGDGVIETRLDLERTSSPCPVNLYMAELEARGSQGTVPLTFTTLPRPALQATATHALRSAQIGGSWQGPSSGAGSINVNLSSLPPGGYGSAYFFINIMARTDQAGGGSVHYRVAYVYGPN